MFDLNAWLSAGAVIAVMAVAGWVYALLRRNVNVVDTLWALFFLAAAVVYAVTASGERAALVLVLVGLWALRLSGHLAWRNRGKAEDHRYQAIRRNNSPNFGLKSLYIVFGLQGLLAWVISLPLLAAITGQAVPGVLDAAGVGLWVVGMAFETVGDWQLLRFRADPANRGRVLDRGLWRYTRHPNYFGEFCIWWGYYMIAVAAGGWWSIAAPLLMSLLLLRVSGVALLEKDIAGRRPSYDDYVDRTNAFFPGPPRRIHAGRQSRP